MNPSLQQSLVHLTGRQDLEEVTAEELLELTRQYPYFSVPHLLLAAKTATTNDTTALQTAALYVDPFWLGYQITDFSGIDSAETSQVTEQAVTARKDELSQYKEQHDALKQADEPVPNQASTIRKAVIVSNATTPEIEDDLSKQSDDNDPAATMPSDEEYEVVPDQFHPEQETIQEELTGQFHIVPEVPVVAIPDNNPEESTETSADPGQQDTSTSSINNLPGDSPTHSGADEFEPDQEFVKPDGAIQPGQAESGDDDASIEVPKAVSISEEELREDEQLLHTIVHHEPVHETIITPVLSQVAPAPELETEIAAGLVSHTEFAKDIEARTNALVNPGDEGTGIPYEPFHTIDYFASQGIQLVLEKDPQDKLGKQLKKFTQWLKHMKKLGPEDALEAVKDTHLETTIQNIADSSNTPRDIVTETMAEVLVKQGKTEQAIQLYGKLSFLNPGKSAYFAAKIHTLKGS